MALSSLSDAQLTALRALCDTYVPSVAVSSDPSGFWARKATDLGVDVEIVNGMSQLPPELVRGLMGLLDALYSKGFAKAGQSQRESMLTQLHATSPEASQGLAFFEKQTLQLTYGLPATPDPDPNMLTYGSPKGQNPNWAVLGYPGPVGLPSKRPKNIKTLSLTEDQTTVDADVCIVGSGAGGSVMAAKLSKLGWNVVVLEAGGHYSSSDFHQLELWGYRHLWYRGGATPTADGNVLLLAGATLGGGTEINWMNCVRTPALVRRNWANEFGITGADTSSWDTYMDQIEERISSSQKNSLYNAQNLRMKEGCERLGYRSTQTHTNWASDKFNPLMAGYTGFGDQSGGKQTARRTFLRDAYDHGARIIVNCHVERILLDRDRACGVEATYSGAGGRPGRLTVRAAQVVSACGSLESPALLLRTGIGGPAVGKYLHLQPGGAVYGIYKDPQKGWWGSPMTANCEQFTDTGDGFGFYMEIPAFGPAFVASVIPWSGGRQHKELITKVPNISTFIWFLRDKGTGLVKVDASGNPVVTYELNDPTDQANFRKATGEAIRIHDAAGAQEILISLGRSQLLWKRGQNLNQFIQTVAKQPLTHGAQPMISAHQLSSCRVGMDPTTSVANPNGELHTVKGVWMADAGACPTALGANPMVTIMALSSRTTDKMVEQCGSRSWRGTTTSAVSSMIPAFSSMIPAVSSMNPLDIPTMATAMAQTGLATATGMLRSMMEMVTPSGIPSVLSTTDKPMNESTRTGAMYSHVLQLQARKGMAMALSNAIRDQAIPRIIRGSRGFVDEIVLVDQEVDRVTAISFWESKQDGESFYANGFQKVSELLAPMMASKPAANDYEVGASTNSGISGWR